MNILLICPLEISCSTTVHSLKSEAEQWGVELNIEAVGPSEAAEEMEEGYDLAIVSQILKYEYNVLADAANKIGFPIYLIGAVEDTPIGSRRLLENILSLYEDRYGENTDK